MKRSTIQCPKNLIHYVNLLNETKARVTILDFSRLEIWTSERDSALATFEFPEEGKIFFAENEQQANTALQAILSGSAETDRDEKSFLAVVRKE